MHCIYNLLGFWEPFITCTCGKENLFVGILISLFVNFGKTERAGLIKISKANIVVKIVYWVSCDRHSCSKTEGPLLASKWTLHVTLCPLAQLFDWPNPSILCLISLLTTSSSLASGTFSVTISGKGPLIAEYTFLGASLDKFVRNVCVQNTLRPSLRMTIL